MQEYEINIAYVINARMIRVLFLKKN